MTAVHEAITTSVVFEHDAESGALTVAQVLGRFDQVRRLIAMQLADTQGVGAGYDRMRVDGPGVAAVDTGDVVTITGLLTASHDRGHLLDYLATSRSRGGRCVLLAQAHGWTLTPATSPVAQSHASWMGRSVHD